MWTHLHFQTFEPRGMVEGHENIKMSNSIIDYVFRALGLEYLNRTDIVQVPPKEIKEPKVTEEVQILQKAEPAEELDSPVQQSRTRSSCTESRFW